MARSLPQGQVKTMCYLFAAIITSLVLSSATAWPEPEREHMCFSTAETREKILAQGLAEPFHAMRTAASRMQAEAIGLKLCRRHSELVYEMSLLRNDGRVIRVFVDAKTGQPVGSKNER
jgi:hypothetical protein